MILIALLFAIGYFAITFEHQIKVNKAASALAAGVLCWVALILQSPDREAVLHDLNTHLADISGILFFLLGAMLIVELIDAHEGFQLVTDRIRTTRKRRLLWLVAIFTFFLSAILDNLTSTIVMVSLLRKLVGERNTRLVYCGMVIIAANAGGAWSPMGDVTTTMLWTGGQVTALNIMQHLFLPSLVCVLVPTLFFHVQLKGHFSPPEQVPMEDCLPSTPSERAAVFGMGLGVLLLVPVFKTFTHLPPFMGILLGLGLMWILTEMLHSQKDEHDKGGFSVQRALQKIDSPSILFFMGILLAVAALESSGLLHQTALWLDRTAGSVTAVGIIIGFVSAVVDNVPLVAAAQGMYSLERYGTDHYFWELLAYCAGTGGSALIIGSAAGVAAMGMEKIDFFWYVKRVSLAAVLGYLAGAAIYALTWPE